MFVYDIWYVYTSFDTATISKGNKNTHTPTNKLFALKYIAVIDISFLPCNHRDNIAHMDIVAK